MDADGTVEWIEAVCADLQVPALSAWGVLEEERDDLIAKSQAASSMKGNPVEFSDEELRGVLREAH